MPLRDGVKKEREPLWIGSTEEFIMNEDFFKGRRERLAGSRMYRIEYGGVNEDCLHEGHLLLPRHADIEAVTTLLTGMYVVEDWTTYSDEVLRKEVRT